MKDKGVKIVGASDLIIGQISVPSIQTGHIRTTAHGQFEIQNV